jgi:hypothetical protein
MGASSALQVEAHCLHACLHAAQLAPCAAQATAAGLQDHSPIRPPNAPPTHLYSCPGQTCRGSRPPCSGEPGA